MRVQILMLKQDDPRKCTAAKLVKFGLAQGVKSTSSKSLVLDPFSARYLLPSDKTLARSITAVDCSWNLANEAFSKESKGLSRKLPPLLAGNPVNYSKIGKLTTVEAISAALYILGFQNNALTLLDKFKWGHTFYTLNKNLLDEYTKAQLEDDIKKIAFEYNLAVSE